ncbi:hypothetical protein EU803_04645 [Loktanella sp. IMCC34160]|uniref:hypothetical protein n=1 Tax=Loktanella sp. IMCC34160 TaxID=2510646 RepID=UPI00101E1EBE|nr:hypothetical protein [Loktanella sp. IMCC34160]RYG91757.1 hypothetical protein EU803_04645 [Loktanella sp. IMCC34160]
MYRLLMAACSGLLALTACDYVPSPSGPGSVYPIHTGWVDLHQSAVLAKEGFQFEGHADLQNVSGDMLCLYGFGVDLLALDDRPIGSPLLQTVLRPVIRAPEEVLVLPADAGLSIGVDGKIDIDRNGRIVVLGHGDPDEADRDVQESMRAINASFEYQFIWSILISRCSVDDTGHELLEAVILNKQLIRAESDLMEERFFHGEDLVMSP